MFEKSSFLGILRIFFVHQPIWLRTSTLPMTTLILKKHGDERIRHGHFWVFSNELTDIPTTLEAGSLVEVQTANGASFGTGIFNPHSLVAVRLLKMHDQELDVALFRTRIAHALHFRERLFPNETSYRLVFGESDMLPGLIIDRYGDYFSVQTLAAGMDTRKDLIIQALRELFPNIQGIIEKNNSGLRQLEGLELREGILWSAPGAEIPEEVLMWENGLQYSVSLLKGQKTGYFLDQKLNRKRIQELTRGMRVMDCFTNQGGFALNAAAGGASYVLGLDSSEAAIQRCRINARLNTLEQAHFETEEVFDFLQAEVAKRAAQLADNQTPPTWDCIILDPPAFTKSRKTIPVARRGYAKINRLALKLLSSGGLLATGSCSHHINEEMFLRIVHEQALIERRELRLVFHGTQSPCHPILMGMPETRYLKFFIFEVI